MRLVVRSKLLSSAGRTTSEAKKMPAMGALKPAATPAAAPEASSASGFWLILQHIKP